MLSASAHRSALRLMDRLELVTVENEGIWRLARSRRHLRFDLRQRQRRGIALVNPLVVHRNVLERLLRKPKILGKHLRRSVRDPVAHQQCVEFGQIAVIEGDNKLGPIGTQTLQGMGKTRREVPQTAFRHIGDLRASKLVENGDAADAGSHDRPFRLLVPMKLSNAIRTEPHVHACDRRRNFEVRRRRLRRCRLPRSRCGRNGRIGYGCAASL